MFKGVRICVFFTVTRHVILIQFHYLFMKFLVQFLRHYRVLIVKFMFGNELTNVVSTCWNLSFGSSCNKLQDMLNLLFVFILVIFDDHEVSNQRKQSWEFRFQLSFKYLMNEELFIFWLIFFNFFIVRFEIIVIFENTLNINLLIEV